MRKSTMVKLSREAFNALEQELIQRVKETGNYRLTLKDLASEIILATLPSDPSDSFESNPPREKKTVEVGAE